MPLPESPTSDLSMELGAEAGDAAAAPETEDMDTGAVQEFVDRLIDSGFARELALKALRETGDPTQVEEGKPKMVTIITSMLKT